HRKPLATRHPPVTAEGSAIACVTGEPPHPDAHEHSRRDQQPQHVRLTETNAAHQPLRTFCWPWPASGLLVRSSPDLGTMMFSLFGTAPFAGAPGCPWIAGRVLSSGTTGARALRSSAVRRRAVNS